MGRISVFGDPVAVADPEDPMDSETEQVDQADQAKVAVESQSPVDADPKAAVVMTWLAAELES